MVNQEKIHNQCLSDDPEERIHALDELEYYFSSMPDKQQAWDDLHRLTNDEDPDVRSWAAEAIGFVLSLVSDKQQAWNELHRLTNDEDIFVRSKAASAIGFAFSQVPDKQQAWNDLHRLTNDEEEYVRSKAASALGSAFSQLPDKQQAWNDLLGLTNDENSWVRPFSNHSLGRVSIFMASQAETDEDFKKELEKAIEFFETSAKEGSSFNPAKFCLPFYRSFHSIIFKKQEAREEVNKYLEEAKSAIGYSESKKQLFEAVENLAEALKEVQNLGNLDLPGMKGELNFYRKYCDHAAELMKNTEEKAPFATKVIRKGLPILDRNLKDLLEEIRVKTGIISEQAKGTRFEELGEELYHSSLSLLQVRDLIGFSKQVQNLENKLSAICSKLPEGQKGEACESLGILRKEHSIEDKIPLINDILSKFSYQLDMVNCLNRIEARLDKLDCISFDIFRLKLNDSNVVSNIEAMKEELEKLNEIARLNESFLDKLNSTQAKELNNVNNNIQDRLDDIGSLIDDLPKNNEIKEILDKLNKLKQSDPDILLQRSSGITSLISFFVMFAQMYQDYIC